MTLTTMDTKKARSENNNGGDSSSESDGDEDISLMEVENGEMINIEFEGFSVTDDDFDGVRQLLVQLFTLGSTVNMSSLTNYLLGQNFIGTVLKQSELQENETDEVYAFTTCVSLTRPHNETADSIKQLLLSKCKSSRASRESKNTFSELISSNTCMPEYNNCNSCIGYIINERFINVPSQACVPMFEKLFSEIGEANSKQHRARYDFTHYIIICKIVKNMGPDTIYLNPEEEFFAEKASLSFDFDVVNEDVSKTRRVLLLSADEMKSTMQVIRNNLPAAR